MEPTALEVPAIRPRFGHEKTSDAWSYLRGAPFVILGEGGTPQQHSTCYFETLLAGAFLATFFTGAFLALRGPCSSTACAAARRATGTRNGEQLT